MGLAFIALLPSEARDLDNYQDGIAVVAKIECSRVKPNSQFWQLRRFWQFYWYSACRPVSRSIRFFIGGCVENKLPMSMPSNGCAMNR